MNSLPCRDALNCLQKQVQGAVLYKCIKQAKCCVAAVSLSSLHINLTLLILGHSRSVLFVAVFLHQGSFWTYTGSQQKMTKACNWNINNPLCVYFQTIVWGISETDYFWKYPHAELSHTHHSWLFENCLLMSEAVKVFKVCNVRTRRYISPKCMQFI